MNVPRERGPEVPRGVSACDSQLVASSCASGPGLGWPAVVLYAGTGKGLFYTRLDVAFRLTANGGQFGNYQIARPLEHPLLAK
jgi:hypothetical protein